MKLRCSIVISLLLILIIFSGSELFAQGGNTIRCTSIDVDKISENTFEFYVNWRNQLPNGNCGLTAANNCLPNEPCPWTRTPISDEVEIEVESRSNNREGDRGIIPAWQYFWIFSDGTTKRTTTDRVTHTFSRNGSHNVSLSMTATYSETDDPEELMRSPSVNVTDAISEPVAYAGELELKVNWDAIELGGKGVVIINYRNSDLVPTADPPRTVGVRDKSGIIKLDFPKSAVTSIYPIDKKIDKNYTPGKPDKEKNSWLWKTGTLSPGEERTIVLEFELSNDYDEENLDIEATLNWRDPLTITGLLGIPSTSNEGFSPASVDDILTNYNERELKSLAVNAVKDPNRIDVDKKVVSPTDRPITLNYIGHVQNLGNAPVDSLVFIHYFDEDIDLPSLMFDNYFPRKNGVCLMLEQSVLNSGFLLNKCNEQIPLSTNRERTFILDKEEDGNNNILAPVIDSDNRDASETKGLFEYRVSTTAPLKDGDTITAVGLIIMNEYSRLKTDTTYTYVRKPKGIRLPWFTGIKIGVNYLDSIPSFTRTNGFQAGFTFRKSFSKIKRHYHEMRRSQIYVNELPGWWFQAELLVNNKKYNANNQRYNIWAAEIPLQIKYVPKLGSLTGFLGISAGYSPLVPIYVSKEGKEESLPSNIFDRIDHFYHFDVSVFNILGSPGISIGGRLNGVIDAESYGLNDSSVLYNLYLHYNF